MLKSSLTRCDTSEIRMLAISLGGPEILIIVLVVLLLFGSTQLPKLARSIGQASNELKKGMNEGPDDDTDGDAGGGDAETESADASKDSKS